jgi:tetratricopeptide (TPR) repeat protein
MVKYKHLIAAVACSLFCTFSAQGKLTVRDRIHYFPILLPSDYDNFVHEKLPEVTLLTETETERAYKQLKELKVNTTTYSWQQLGICFMLQNKVEESLNCFIKAEEAITRFYDNAMFKAWLMEQNDDDRRAAREWARLLEQDTTSYGYAIRLACCQLKMRQALGVAQTMKLLERRAPTDPITPHLQGVRYFMIGDFIRATESFVKSTQLAGEHTLPETYMAMAMLTLHEEKREEVLGWLKLAITHASDRNKVVYYNLPPFQEFHEDKLFLALGTHFNLPLLAEGVNDEFLADLPRPGMEFYLAKFNVPENLRIELALQLHNPLTDYRTLGFRQKRKKEALERIRLEAEAKIAEEKLADQNLDPESE